MMMMMMPVTLSRKTLPARPVPWRPIHRLWCLVPCTSQVHGILENVPVRDAAVNYEGRLIGVPNTVLPRNGKGFPVFDLMLLGLGPDGHIGSLFPHRSTLSEEIK